MALIDQAVSEEKTFEIVDERTTDDGPWVYYKLNLWAWRLRWAKKIAALNCFVHTSEWLAMQSCGIIKL